MAPRAIAAPTQHRAPGGRRAKAPRPYHQRMVVASPPANTLRVAELRLARLALDLGAADAGGPLASSEADLIAAALTEPMSVPDSLEEARAAIRAGGDPLGDELLRIRPGAERRGAGAFYTPSAIVNPMVTWALSREPVRVVDAGCGSGRFAAAVVRARPDLVVVALDTDPLATLLTRAALSVLGAHNARVLAADFTALSLEPADGPTAWIGNPPYVRHHDLPPTMKAWAAEAGARLGHPFSALSGLHAYFFLATAIQAAPGDFGCYVTSAEWLDVGYGSVIRDLLLDGLGGLSLHAFDPRAIPFADVMTTAVIATFEAGAHPEAVRLARIREPDDLADLGDGRPIPRATLAAMTRWSALFDSQPSEGADPLAAVPVRLGEIARVHRGEVSGGNDFFVLTREQAAKLCILEWCKPAITEGIEILDGGGVVRDEASRRVILAPPRDVDRKAHPALDRYLKRGERRQPGEDVALAHRYIASRRRPWWFLGRLPAPPIVASYMARRPPAFALNPDRLVLLNIAHGLWPVEQMPDERLTELVAVLNAAAAGFRGKGRTYHGGLEKFEPREMEALIVPDGNHLRP